MHLAGHGHYEPPTTAGGKARSGMVLDNGVFLTAVEVGQMQQVPELVFLNCCHIGQTGPEATPRTPTVEFNRLAASVSRELIEMGVRAVVAAGWAVADDAAKEFRLQSSTNSMLGGESFGRALKAARIHTHDNFPDSNTWGAYQAYGDPDYRLDPAGSGTRPTGLDQVDVAEFIDAVDDIGRTAETGTGAGKSLSTAVKTLDALVKDCPADWLAQTDVQMAIGYAYGRLKQFEVAGRVPRRARLPVRATHPRRPCLRSKNSPTSSRAMPTRSPTVRPSVPASCTRRPSSASKNFSPLPRQRSATTCSEARTSAAPPPKRTPKRPRGGAG